jgi:hypothetical protein
MGEATRLGNGDYMGKIVGKLAREADICFLRRKRVRKKHGRLLSRLTPVIVGFRK